MAAKTPDGQQPGFSSKKLNELIDLTRAANRHAANQVESTRALEQLLTKMTASARPAIAPLPKVAEKRSRFRTAIDLTALIAAIATVVALAFSAWSIRVAVDSLEVAIDSAERASITQTYYAPIQFCSIKTESGEFAEGGEVFSVITNTGRLPITVTGVRAADGDEPRDLSYVLVYLDGDRPHIENKPFKVDVGEAVAISVLYGRELGTKSDDGIFTQTVSSHAKLLLSDGTEIIPSQNNREPAPELVRELFRGLTQLTCDGSRFESPTEGDKNLFDDSENE